MTMWKKMPELHHMQLTPGQVGFAHFSQDRLHFEVTATVDSLSPFTLTSEQTGSVTPDAMPAAAQNTSSPSTGFSANGLLSLTALVKSEPISHGDDFRYLTIRNAHATATIDYYILAGRLTSFPVIEHG